MFEQRKQEALRHEYVNKIKAKIFLKDQLIMKSSRWGVTVQGTHRDSVNTPEAYLERFPRWQPRVY